MPDNEAWKAYQISAEKAGYYGWNNKPRDEQQVLMREFRDMLWLATRDGAGKRSAGLKQPWWCDDEHEAAIFSHLNKWKHGELVDDHSGAHPLVHLAWRALALAYQETHGKIEPTEG